MESAIDVAAADPRVLGVLVLGSFADNTADEVSNIDLLVVLARGAFNRTWSDRTTYSAGALRAWDVEADGRPVGAHKWVTRDLVLVECLFSEAGSGVRLAPPFVFLNGSEAAIDGLERRAPIPRSEVEAGAFVGDPAEWLYDALKLTIRGDVDGARRVVQRLAALDSAE